MNDLAGMYAHKYVIKKYLDYDATQINNMFNKLLEPLTVEEIDSGRFNYMLPSTIGSKNFRDNMLIIKNIGSLTGYVVEFRPLVAYDIYRDLQIVGGYFNYTYPYNGDADKILNTYVSQIQNITKEIIPQSSRPIFKQKIQKSINFMNNDKSLKIFIIKNGEIDSMFEREV